MKDTLDSTGSNEDGKFKRGGEDYEHLLIDLKAMGLEIKILPEEKDQIMFDPGEEIKAHGDLDSILRGEKEVPRRVSNTKDRDWDDSTWCGMEWDEAETLFPAPILWERRTFRTPLRGGAVVCLAPIRGGAVENSSSYRGGHGCLKPPDPK